MFAALSIVPPARRHAGVAIFNQELSAGGGASRTETYYRKALVAKMYFGADGQTVTATSEEYSRSTVKEAAARTGAGAARAKAAAAAAAAREQGADGASAEKDVDALDAHVGAADAMDDFELSDSDLDTSQPADAEGGELAQGQAQQGQVLTTVVTATISGAAAQQQPQVQKDAEAQAAAEAAATAAQQQQQQQPASQAAEQQQQPVDPADISAWWSDVVSADGERVPKPGMRERDISASLASAGGHAPLAAWLSCTGGLPCAVVLLQALLSAAACPLLAWLRFFDPPGRPPARAGHLASSSASHPSRRLAVESAAPPPPPPPPPHHTPPLSVTFDESAVGDLPDCKIAVLDVDREWGDKWGAGRCDLADARTWPFAAPGRGIDGHASLAPEHYQYSMEYWIAQVRLQQGGGGLSMC